jgi:phage tail-like protein
MAEYNDPYGTYRFHVTFEHVAGDHKEPQKVGFQSVSGLSLNVNTMDYREGNEPTTIVRKIPGLTKIGNVTFKWGMIAEEKDTADGENAAGGSFYAWLGGIASMAENGPQGGLTLMNIDIKLMNFLGQTEGTPEWKLYRCYPISFSVPDLNASSNTLAITSMEFAVGGFEFIAPTAQNLAVQTSGGNV